MDQLLLNPRDDGEQRTSELFGSLNLIRIRWSKSKQPILAHIDDEDVVKVLDFGIAKEGGPKAMGAVTQTGEVLGSPYYMSPEQVRGDKELDHRSDLWSLGVILFRAITGELPFPGEQLGTVMAKIMMDPIPLARSIAPDLPPEIDAFFARTFARDRTLRFQSVKEMIAELGRLSGTPRAAMGSVSDMTMTPTDIAGRHPGATQTTPDSPFTTTPLPQRIDLLTAIPEALTVPIPGNIPAQHVTAPQSGIPAQGTQWQAGVAPRIAEPAETLGGATDATGTNSSWPRPSRAAGIIAWGAASIVLAGVAAFGIWRLLDAPSSEATATDPQSPTTAESAQLTPEPAIPTEVPETAYRPQRRSRLRHYRPRLPWPTRRPR